MTSPFRPFLPLWSWPLPRPPGLARGAGGAPPPVPTLPAGPLAPEFASEVGTVLPFMGPLPDPQGKAPPRQLWGWLLCDGSKYRISELPELFQAIGHLYSADTSGDFFQVPDLRGYFLRGVDADGLRDRDAASRTRVDGQSSSGIGSFQADAFQEHEHDYKQGGIPLEVAPGSQEAVSTSSQGTTTQLVKAEGADAPSSSKHETRPKNVAVHYFIRCSSASSPPWVPPLPPF